MDLLKFDNLLRQAGWRIRRSDVPRALPSEVVARYPWVTSEMLEYSAGLDEAVSSDEKAWLLAPPDFAGNPSGAYAWNEWELQSLVAAADDDEWRAGIQAFWDRHFPILMSVKSGYAYFAIDRESRAIVVGEEPEFEEAAPIAPDMEALLQKIASGDAATARWV